MAEIIQSPKKDGKDTVVTATAVAATTAALPPLPSKDKLFDPSVDMLVNDFDDERTLEEEEALAAGESDDPNAELSSLQKVMIPILCVLNII